MPIVLSPLFGSFNRFAMNSVGCPPDITVPLAPGCTIATVVPEGATSSMASFDAPGYQSSNSFSVWSLVATFQPRSYVPPCGTMPAAWMPSAYEFDAAMHTARLGCCVSNRSMPCSTSVVPSCGPPFVPRLTLIAHGVVPASLKMNVSASSNCTESPNDEPITSSPCHAMSLDDTSTNTMSACGAMPGTPVPRPLPAAMSITCVPCAGSLGSGPYPSAM